jgi:hypothetical protein
MRSISTRQPFVPGLLDLSEDELAQESRKLDAYWILVLLIVAASAALVFFATHG